MSLSKKEEKILKSIVVASENDPNKPEFPADDPKYPATPTYKIKVPGFTDVWLKDESHNPTGTHKDRMAWEIIVTYRDFLLAKKRGQIKGKIPAMSIISSGSAAVAIQTQLKRYDLPNLKVFADENIDSKVLKAMERIGCEIYKTDLRKKAFHWKEILELTNNPDGLDITSSEALDPTTRFYDWLSYEIINSSPDYCFIPFGTGNLFENILNINKKEVSTKYHDPRFKGKLEVLRRCNFLGATTNNPKSKADKLYSPHLPFVHFDEQWIRLYRQAGYCGSESNVILIKEQFLDKAMKLAESQGINCEPSGIAGLALLLQMKNKIPKDKKILIVSTGKSKCP
ncbi:PLP-dependent lyase/thiolase [Patescibacteria group bacterium]|nr:PLP-dependent lyase/thiolase [Patescibacteria group bacterium]MBU1703662.1 PLP-dependent lyase/thiolase [Patescibacteria group bacterium]MBU1954332.1 PLP-dependent lyase/thiolase [Patescibacteria group bacterium]